MRRKATHVYAGFDNPDARPFTLSPLAIEDLTGEPAFTFTPEGLEELATAAPQTLEVKGQLAECLKDFQEAFLARQQARGLNAVASALNQEERTALSLAWTILSELGLL